MTRLLPRIEAARSGAKPPLSIGTAIEHYRQRPWQARPQSAILGYLHLLDIADSGYLEQAALIAQWKGRPLSAGQLGNASRAATVSAIGAVFTHIRENEPALAILVKAIRSNRNSIDGLNEHPMPIAIRWALADSGLSFSENSKRRDSITTLTPLLSQPFAAANLPAGFMPNKFATEAARREDNMRTPIFLGTSGYPGLRARSSQNNKQLIIAANSLIAFRQILCWHNHGNLDAALSRTDPTKLSRFLLPTMKRLLDFDHGVLAAISEQILARDRGKVIPFRLDWSSWLSDLPSSSGSSSGSDLPRLGKSES